VRRFLGALLGFVIGYPVFAVVGYFAIGMVSNNHFDPSVEAAMTAMFVFGPLGAVTGALVGAILGKPRRVQ
jgi:glycerol uptake facilitator-like aquaporin